MYVYTTTYLHCYISVPTLKVIFTLYDATLTNSIFTHYYYELKERYHKKSMQVKEGKDVSLGSLCEVWKQSLLLYQVAVCSSVPCQDAAAKY